MATTTINQLQAIAIRCRKTKSHNLVMENLECFGRSFALRIGSNDNIAGRKVTDKIKHVEIPKATNIPRCRYGGTSEKFILRKPSVVVRLAKNTGTKLSRIASTIASRFESVSRKLRRILTRMWTQFAYFYEPWAIEAFDRAVQGVQNAKIIVHICWGNWGGTPAYYPDDTADAGEIFDLTIRQGDEPSATASVIPKSYEANIDVLNLENCGRRSDDLSGLDVVANNPVPEHIQFWAGVVDVKSTITETAEQVAGRIRRLLEYVPANQLGVTTDCGLILLQRYIAKDKLHAMVSGAKIVRAELG